MTDLKISVITPSFNQAPYIRRTIESVLSQNDPNFEHIVMDGGSTDGTVDILKEYNHLNWVSEKDDGQSDAINRGILKSTGDIIAWCNSDDLYAPGGFTAVRGYLDAHPDARIVSGNAIYIDDKDHIIRRRPPIMTRARLLAPWSWTGGTSVFQVGTLFFREVFDRFGPLDETFHYGMDYNFFLRATTAYSIHALNEDVGYFRIQPDAKTSEGWDAFGPDLKRALINHVEQEQGLLQGRWVRARLHLYDGQRWLTEALIAYEQGRLDDYHRFFERAVRRNPMVLVAYPHLCFRLKNLVGETAYAALRKRYHAAKDAIR